jgi:hypothetical protein
MSLWVRSDKSKLHKGEDNMLREAEKYKNVKALYVRFLLETKIDMKQVTDMLSKVSNITHIELLEDGRLLFVYDFGEAPSEKDYDECSHDGTDCYGCSSTEPLCADLVYKRPRTNGMR